MYMYICPSSKTTIIIMHSENFHFTYMYVCIYIYIYIYIHTHTHIYIYACIYPSKSTDIMHSEIREDDDELEDECDDDATSIPS
jgi:hypothetical protein